MKLYERCSSMKVQSASNSVCERVHSTQWRTCAFFQVDAECRVSMVALALLKTSAKSWCSWGTPERLGLSTGGEADAEQSFASSAWMYSVKFVAPWSLQACTNAAVPISET